MIHNLTLEPVRLKTGNPGGNAELRFRVTMNQTVLGVWRFPETSAARKLMDLGVASRNDTLETWIGGTRSISASVGWLSERTVVEGDDAPRLNRWTSWCGGMEKPASEGEEVE